MLRSGQWAKLTVAYYRQIQGRILAYILVASYMPAELGPGASES